VRPDSLVRLAEAAKRLDASRSSLYRLRDRGLLPFIYLAPDMPRVRERDLSALIEQGGGDRAGVA
jgi:predicted DNA-binding transcriptional regulator AlpA